MSLRNYVSKQAAPQLLKEGDNVVSIKSYVECDTFSDVRLGPDGKLYVAGKKDKLPEWKNAINQNAYHLIGESGSLVHRQAENGVRAYSDLSDEERNSGLFVEKNTFACTMVNGQLERVEHPEHTATCTRMIQDFLFAVANGKTDLNGQEIIDNAIATQSKFVVTVKKDPWRDPESGELTTQVVATGFKPISKAKPATEQVASKLQA